jgi:hypothetical protein
MVVPHGNSPDLRWVSASWHSNCVVLRYLVKMQAECMLTTEVLGKRCVGFNLMAPSPDTGNHSSLSNVLRR